MTSNQPSRLTELYQRWATPPGELVGHLPRGGTQLDYLGHATVTRALLECDPTWSWEPLAWTEHGTPYIGHQGNRLVMWIRLTVCDVDRLGVGTCRDDKADPEKELIGDALRNAAMRFGVALSLWSKEEWQGLGVGSGGFSVDVSQDMQPDPAPTQIAGSGEGDALMAKSADDGIRHVPVEPPDPDPVPDEEHTTRAVLRGTIMGAIAQLDDEQKRHVRTWMRDRKWTLKNLDQQQLGMVRSYVEAINPTEPEDTQLTLEN